MALKVEIVPLLKDNFSYILNDSVVIDPSEFQPLKARLRKLDLILCTHHHWDHVGGALELSTYFKCPIWASKWDKERIEGCSRGCDDGEELEVGGQRMRILHVPGHTEGQISFYFPDAAALFVGDTLFSLGCGRLFEGTPEQMFGSLKKICELPDETKIYFGHEYTLKNGAFAITLQPELSETKTYLNSVKKVLDDGGHSTPGRLGLEKRINPFLNTNSLSEWTRRRALRNQA